MNDFENAKALMVQCRLTATDARANARAVEENYRRVWFSARTNERERAYAKWQLLEARHGVRVAREAYKAAEQNYVAVRDQLN